MAIAAVLLACALLGLLAVPVDVRFAYDSAERTLELAWGGKEPLALPGGLTRSFLQDGDTVTLRGAARGADYRIGFGACEGRILPALSDPTQGA